MDPQSRWTRRSSGVPEQFLWFLQHELSASAHQFSRSIVPVQTHPLCSLDSHLKLNIKKVKQLVVNYSDSKYGRCCKEALNSSEYLFQSVAATLTFVI